VDLDIPAGRRAGIAGVMVRPEKIEVHLEPPPVSWHRNAFPAQVKDVLYQGNFTRVTATLGDVEVAAVVQNVGRRAADGLEPGRRIYLSIDPDSFCVFGDDGRSG
jgi:ABC-type Fe3+/spermidine/putrescine transport system ATPase subunit